MNDHDYYQLIIDFAEDFFRIRNPGGKKWACRDFIYYGIAFQNSPLPNLSSYSGFDFTEEKPIIIVKESWDRPLNRGILITNKKIYYNPNNMASNYQKVSYELSNVNFFLLKQRLSGVEIVINDNKIGQFVGWGPFFWNEANIITEFVNSMIEIMKRLELHSSPSMQLNNSLFEKFFSLYKLKNNDIITPEDYSAAKTKIVTRILGNKDYVFNNDEKTPLLLELMDDHISKFHPANGRRKYLSMHFAPFIPEEFLNEAYNLYAFFNSEVEKPLMLFRLADYRVKGAGLLITDKAIYYYLPYSQALPDCLNSFSLDDISEFNIERDSIFTSRLTISGIHAAIIFIKNDERKVLNKFVFELLKINNKEKREIWTKYNLGTEDPLVLLSQLYQHCQDGIIDRSAYFEKKNELLRII